MVTVFFGAPEPAGRAIEFSGPRSGVGEAGRVLRGSYNRLDVAYRRPDGADSSAQASITISSETVAEAEAGRLASTRNVGTDLRLRTDSSEYRERVTGSTGVPWGSGTGDDLSVDT